MKRKLWFSVTALLVCMSVCVFLDSLIKNSPGWLVDFKAMYYTTLCLMKGYDPYSHSQIISFISSQNAISRRSPIELGQTLTYFDYLPTAFLILAPISFFSWKVAHLVWMGLTVISLFVSAALCWRFGASYSPKLALILAGIVLANCEGVLALGNPAGLVTGMLVIGSLCFIAGRFPIIGIICFSVSLSLKPHVAGMIWLYFLLRRGTSRKRALYSAGLALLIVILSVVWVSTVAPHWAQELRSNLQTIFAPGGENNPAPDSPARSSIAQVINIQALINSISDSTKIYSFMSLGFIGVLVCFWIWATLKSGSFVSNEWLALASMSAIAMLPIYHRLYDAKVIMLSIPACSILWMRRGIVGWMSLIFTGSTIALTADLPNILLSAFAKNPNIIANGWEGKIETVVLYHSATIALMVMGLFYLVVYVRSVREESYAHSA